MNARTQILALAVIVCLAGMLMWHPSYGQDEQPTAAQLLVEGLDLIDSGQVDEARAKLERVDAAQLDAEQRQALAEAHVQLAELAAAEAPAEEAEADAPEPVEEAEPVEAAEAVAEEPEAPEVDDGDWTEWVAAEGDAEEAVAEDAAPVEEQVEAVAAEAEPIVEAEADASVEADEGEVAEVAEAEVAEAEVAEAEVAEAEVAEAEVAEAEVAEAEAVEPPAPDVIETARLLRAQQLIAEADQALDAGEYNRAEALYTEALALDEDNADAEKGLAQVRLERPVDEGILGPIETERELREQRTLARYDEAIRAGETSMNVGNFAQASDEARRALEIVNTNRQFLADAEFAARKARAEALSDQIALRQQRKEARDMAAAAKQAADDARLRKAQEMMESEQRIQQLLREARQYQIEKKYELALQKVDELLFQEDPNNVAALAMKDMIEEVILFRGTRAGYDERRYQKLVNWRNNVHATIPQQDLVLYPQDWPALTRKRLGELGGVSVDSDENRLAQQNLQRRIDVPDEFESTTIGNAIEWLGNMAEINVFINWSALEIVGADEDTRVSLAALRDVPAQKVLELVLEQASGGGTELEALAWSIDMGVVTISTRENLARQTMILTYDIRDLLMRIPTYRDAPELDLDAITEQSQSGSGGGGGGGSSIFEEQDEDDDEEEESQQLEEIMELIRTSVDPESWDVTGSIQELNGVLIVRSTQQNHADIQSLLEQLRDTRALQIAIEARFLLVDQNFLEDVGLDVDVTIGESDNVSEINIDQGSFDLTQVTEASLGALLPTTAALAVTGPAGGAVSLFLDDIQVDFMLRASQTSRNAISLTAPRLTFFNGQWAWITVATQRAFVADLEPVTGTGSVAFDPTPDTISDGVTLAVQGTVSADRRYVTLNLEPSLSQLIALRTFPVFAATEPTGDEPGDTEFGIGFLQQPEIQFTALRTSVSVPDKGTLLLGGQRLVGEVEVEAGVPVLSKVPLLNRFFTNRSMVKEHRSLLILVKPIIIIPSEEEERNFPGLQQSTQGLGQVAPGF